MKHHISKLYAIIGSFIITAGWGWYHINHHPRQVFIIKELAVWLGVYCLYRLGKLALVYILQKLKQHHFWHETFIGFLDPLFFYFSLLFVIFFFKNELWSLAYVTVLMCVLYLRLQKYLQHHPDAQQLRRANKAMCALAYFIFIVQAVLQYSAYHYYILDSNVRFFNIVLFRSVAMTLFWLAGFAVASYFYNRFSGILKYFLVVLWSVLFLAFLGVWVINIGILYYSGLYLSPVALEHASGAGDVAGNSIVFWLIAGALIVAVFFIYVVHHVFKAHDHNAKRYWFFYNSAIVLMAVSAFAALTSFRNTPEHTIVKSFYQYYTGETVNAVLDPAVQKKLEKFGLFYNTDNFLVSLHANVYSPTSTHKFLPARFDAKKPNIVFVFLEGFSARLTDMYNPGLHGVTPQLDAFVADPHTTIFKNYYNASTPTITGTLSQLCSFLPPTGHEEIQTERKLQSHRLLCLPEVLKNRADYKYASYITAVDKEYAHKDGIFTSMGVDKIFGTEELKKYISGEPLSWGYSDHQLFPALWNFMQTAPQPFVMMLATVDTHPPFNLSKDAGVYGDGKDEVLNTFHSTDDAFGKFWTEFKSSPYYQNTIIVAVADHAIFPGALSANTSWPKDFPDQKSQHTYYDQNTFLMYVPDGALPKEVTTTSSGLDVVPTLLQVLGINGPNTFEGHSIFDDQVRYPSVLGMHELGLYINQQMVNGKRQVNYNIPSEITCAPNYTPSSTPDLTECDYLQFYNWKRHMFEDGRFWKN